MGKKWMRSTAVVWEDLDVGALLIDTSENSAWVLNESAAQIWRACEQRGIDRIAREIARAANRQLSQVRADVRAFAGALQQRGWLQMADGCAQPMPVEFTVAFRNGYSAPMLSSRSLTGGPRRRPSPRGNSGPG